MKHILILSGAGVSAESGLQTFRDADGLWEGYSIEDVASIEGWHKNPKAVLDFYNQRRANVLEAQPNLAHLLIADLETAYRVTVVTQNIDDLHERAGSSNILHLHGQITKMRSVQDENTLYDYMQDIQLGDTAKDGAQLRPHIVWFGEAVPMITKALELIQQADIVIVIGTSLQVYPAAGLLTYVPEGVPVYVIDKKIPPVKNQLITAIEKPATLGMQELYQKLMPK